ncbi:LANO_0G10000g1_1 [Lachancea nothofagi CBS 11611]|uniref:LANO_0G10000g1_1 n=1 Tax=Lachancea nothofagi CBS 11611 TaxID=1266666 RepID=A0A1G4KIT1_9SACH|nr:LANO_0G10000g1_1 [Lachancea nothofagi CBS 11611]
MSSFWDQNKGTIKAGLATAGKYGYQGTKFVAKTGYNAGKQQYNNSKGITTERSNSPSSSLEETIPGAPIPSVAIQTDVSNLPPPPLKPGQSSYHGSSRSGAPRLTTITPAAPMYPGTIQEASVTVQAPVPAYQEPQMTQTQYLPATRAAARSQPVLPSRTASAINTPNPLHIDTKSVTNQDPLIYQRAVLNAPVAEQVTMPIPSTRHETEAAPASNTIAVKNAQPPIYTAPETSTTNVQQPSAIPSIPQRTYFRAPAALPTEQSITPASEQLAHQEEINPKFPHQTVKPYEWKDADQLREMKKVHLPAAEASALSPPPRRRDTSASPSRGSGSPQQSLISPVMTKPLTSVRTSDIEMSQTLNPQSEVESVNMADERTPINLGVAGRYSNTGEVNFPPPPRLQRSEVPPAVSSRQTNITPQPSGGSVARRAPPSLPERTSTSSTVPLSSRTTYTPSQSAKKQVHDKNEAPRSAVLGSYNYNRPVDFQPPPKPFRRGTETSISALPTPPPAPARLTTPTYVDEEPTHPESYPPPYSLVEVPPCPDRTINLEIFEAPIPKAKKLPPAKKAFPHSLQSLNNGTTSSKKSDSVETKTAPPKPARKNLSTPPPKPSKKPQLPYAQVAKTPGGEGNDLNAELQAKFNLKKTPKPTETIESAPSLAETSTTSFIDFFQY